jgi:hypothetical protein
MDLGSIGAPTTTMRYQEFDIPKSTLDSRKKSTHQCTFHSRRSNRLLRRIPVDWNFCCVVDNDPVHDRFNFLEWSIDEQSTSTMR